MGSWGNYAENKQLEHGVGKTAWTMPSVWIALSKADPTDDASGLDEPSVGSYVRKATVGADWNNASGGALDNANDLVFVQATADWGTITHFAGYDAVSGGNMVFHGALGASRVVNNGDTFKFLAGDLDISQD